MQQKVSIYQIYYLSEQLKILDPAFIPYDNTKNENPKWREYFVFQKEYEKKSLFLNAELVGFFSWKFNKKSHLQGKEFIQFVLENPGHDIYLVNPYPHSALQFRNIWIQGEHFHPGIIEIADFIFKRMGLNYDFTQLHSHNDFFCCNYWVANEKFWNKYILIGEKIKKIIEEDLPPHLQKRIHTRASDTINCDYIPFLYERLITTILTSTLNEFKVAKYQFSLKKLLKRYGKKRLIKLYLKYFSLRFSPRPTLESIISSKNQ